MVLLNDLLFDLTAILAFGALGIVLMALGFLLVDVLTPGKLGELIWSRRNANAAVVLASSLLGVGGIVTTAIVTSYDEFVRGLASTALYGVLGLVLMAIAFLVVDVLTPGKLGSIVTRDDRQPAAWVVGTAHVSVAAIVCAAIA